ncbi:MAG: hypothetical protein A2Y12_14175 [Planctomycetes bacterium GWF2_42_9]|nr:MAG: hypothetical protein A2Y12_14175 [Planctomycetes bacterium GWF2_42_9]
MDTSFQKTTNIQNKKPLSLSEFLRSDNNKTNDSQMLIHDLGISIAPPDSPKGIAKPSESDFQIYIPSKPDAPDSCNQHFIVIPLSNGDFLATWTTASLEGTTDQRVVIARSSDQAKTWTRPQCIIGPQNDGYIASWSFLFVVPRTGRVYLFYNKHRGFVDYHHQWTGQLWFQYSDDNGCTWSKPYTHLKLEPNDFSHRDINADSNWIVYQPPILTLKGNVIVGFTHVASKKLSQNGIFPSEARFIQFKNILTEDVPEKLAINCLPENGQKGLRMQDPRYPGITTLQEPSIQCLSDGRLFCVMRSATGYVAYSISKDDGKTWSTPDFLRFHSGGPKIPQPIVPCPLYKLGNGKFILIYHNNSGDANYGRHVSDWCRNRRPVYLSVGYEVNSDGNQPIVFNPPVMLADNDRVPIGKKQLTEIGTYSSLFEYEGKIYFFYPDRKHYLLGKILASEML